MEEEKEIIPEEENKKGQKKQNKSYFYCGLITGLALALLLISSAYLFTRIEAYREAKSREQAQSQEQSTGTGTEKEAASVVNEQTLAKMQAIEKAIELYYYQEDVDKEVMADSVYRGMVASLGDPYSEYFTQEELNEVLNSIEGIYYGIGAYVQMDIEAGMCKISGVIDNSPAQEADVRENDLIYKVGEEEVYGMSTTEVVKRIKGPEGTKIKITFIRGNEYVEIEVERREVVSPTVDYNIDDEGIAYIQIKEFDEVTVDQFAEALAVSRGSGMKKMILDLRSNPGGSLDAVVEIARMLLPEGMIVYTEDRDGNRREYKGDGSKVLEVPLVVLVNGNSASASEVLAGAIKDYGTGMLLGTTTYGKGIVQQPLSLGDGSAVKLTVSRYFTPKGINIHGTGIEPDEVCEFDGERYYGPEGFDTQLERAKEILRNK